MSETCHQTLADDPNTKIIIAGYINHLNIKELMQRYVGHATIGYGPY